MDSKFITKAKTALHNAAAKAERVLIDIKSEIAAEFSSHGELPWFAKNDGERVLEQECRTQILHISQSSDFLHCDYDAGVHVDMNCARAILEYDENLRNLRLQHVPKLMKEKEFWKRYFSAVNNVKHDIYQIEPSNLDSRPETESPREDPFEEESYKKAVTIVAAPPSPILRRLSSAIQFSRAFETMQDLAASGDTDSSQGPDWPSLVSGLRKLSSRDKDVKSKAQGGNVPDHRYSSLLWPLFDGEAPKQFATFGKATLAEELHGAPPQSFVVQLAEVTSGLKFEHRMAEFWLEVVKECRRRWRDGQPIPHMPLDATPDLRTCLLHQQLQVLNCCIARRERRVAAVDSLNILQTRQSLGAEDSVDRSLFAKLKDGNLAPRLGVERPTPNVNMLETGEPVYSPVTQEGPVLTEELIKETEELVLRTGSFGAGCSQLFSDMQAFKAANPGCILEDFVRWYSPPDWSHEPESNHPCEDGESSLRGHLSTRMKCEGNLWQELWFSARPVPAVVQAPLFDEELAGESVLNNLEDISPGDFFEQLYIAALTAGFAIAEGSPLSEKEPLAAYLKECKDHVLQLCQHYLNPETLEDLCQVYELMEAAIHAAPEGLSVFPNRLRKFPQQGGDGAGDKSSNNAVSSVVRFFESKFDRKTKHGGDRKKNPPKIVPAGPATEEWTIV